MSIYVLLFVTWGHYLNLVSWITVFNRVHFELFKWLSSRLVKEQWDSDSATINLSLIWIHRDMFFFSTMSHMSVMESTVVLQYA